MLTRRLFTRSLINCVRQSSTLFNPKIYAPPRNLIKYSTGGTNTYEGDGKTSVQILNKELDAGLMINSFSQVGFRLNNGMMILGPMAIFPKTVLSWNISDYEEINEKTLSLFCVLDPKIDVLVLGIGDQPLTPKFSKNIVGFMKKYGINVEVLPTEQACATFNFLNSEGRMVGGALIPPNHLSINENDLARTQLDRTRILQVDD